ncbi:MAG TPA: hypothetical protein VL098_10190 [Flavipsychrobacter sp.]|nr:hypothetical protein [Flavipsychrobacter sp.]
MLKQTFIRLLTNYTNDNHLISNFWTEVEECYLGKNRYYHTLQHLENLLRQLIEVKEEINNWDAILFALYYHDIIYNSLRSDNEEKSAELAEERMRQIPVSDLIIVHCKKQILATRSHIKSPDSDVNYFTDADLSILGQPWEVYLLYYQNVRKEYSHYPDIIYNPGRKKVLDHFLAMDRIFKTDFFYRRFETQARQNFLQERELL